MKRATAFLFLASAFALAQTDNTLHVKDFPGNSVGQKLANAQAACNPDTSVACVLVLDPALAADVPGTFPPLCSQCSIVDDRSGTPNLTAAGGVFLNRSTVSYAGMLLHGLDPQTEFQLVQGPQNAVNAVIGGLNVPSGASSWNNNALAGYAVSDSPSAKVNTVGVYTQARAAVSGAQVWGANPLVVDGAGISAGLMIGTEIDVNVKGTPANLTGLMLNGIGGGTFPAGSTALWLTGNYTASHWTNGFGSGDGVASNAFVNGALSQAKNSYSQSTIFRSYDSRGTLVQSTLRSDPSGDLQYTSDSRNAALQIDGQGYLNYYASVFPTHLNTQSITWSATSNFPTIHAAFTGWNASTGNGEADYYTGTNLGGIAHQWWVPNVPNGTSTAWFSLMKLDYQGNLTPKGNVVAAEGTNVVYRCTTAGILPVGTLTIAPESCGASADTGLRVK